MRTLTRLTGVTLAAAPVAFLAAALAAGPLRAQTTATVEVRLRPGDAVRLEAYAERASPPPEPQRRPIGEYAIDERGQVLLPVAGLIQVVGRPFSEVRAEVERAFAAEFVDAAVRVTPLLRIAVLGEVRQPGLFPVDPTMSLADVIALAGGLTMSANRGDVRLVREEETLMVTDQGSVAGVDVPIESGDRIVVGRRSWAAENLPLLIGTASSVLVSLVTVLILR